MSLYLGIDTSNYTTSVAVADEGGVVENIKIPLTVKPGERGLRQSDALFLHTSNLPDALGKLSSHGFSAVGVSDRPRGAEGSYMPCFLAGVSAASAAAAALGVPLYRFSHQAGHVMAALYGSGAEDLCGKEFLAFHVSGGTTEVLYVNGDSIEKKGGTLDINAGQLIDRTGVKLGFSFPCGAALEKAAAESPEKPRVCVNGLFCNLSGAENKVDGFISAGVPAGSVAAYVIQFVALTLDRITENALAEFGNLPLVYAGGVMSNGIIRKYFEDKYGAYFSKPEFASDNAAGTALLCRKSHTGR